MFAIFTTASVNAALITATWIGPGDGNWSESAKWSRTGVPNNGGGNTFAVVINPGGTFDVVLNQDAVIDSLVVGGNDTLSFNNDRDLTIMTGPITNNGVVTMNSTGNGTELRINSNLTMGGSGEWVLGNHSANIFRNNFGGITRLTNGPSHTISGAGQIGVNSLFLTNSGLIDANLATAMQFDLREEESNFNTGVMQASGGGTLLMSNSGTLDNTDGVVQALADSFVVFQNTLVIGGEFHTEGTGVIRPSTSVPMFQDIWNTGHIQHANDLDASYAGTIVNDGVISLESTGNGTDMRLHTTPTRFTGSGMISMSDSLNNIIRNNFGVITRLEHSADHTIEGAGQLGANSLFLTNHGLIDANRANAMQCDLREEENNFNDGVMQASGGGTLLIVNSGTLDNTGGVIQALTGSVVTLQSSTIVGGTLDTEGTGVIRPSTAPPALMDVTNEGVIELANDLDCVIVNSIVNNNTIRMQSTGNGTDLRLSSAVTTFTGSGVVTMSDHINNLIRNNFGGLSRLQNEAGHTFEGAGQLGANSLFLTNNGLIDANQPTALQFDLREEEVNENNGTIQASNGGTAVFVNSGTIDNTNGVIQALDNSVVWLQNTHIVGGVLDSEGMGFIRPSTSVPNLEDVTNEGVLRFVNDDDCAISGTITNNGTIELNSVGNGTEIRVNSAVATLDGPGELVMSNHVNNFIRYNFGGLTQFVNGADHTIRGGGQIGLNSIGIVNNGTIISDVSAGISFDARNEVGGFVNNGLLHVMDAGVVSIQPDAFTNTGDVIVDATRQLFRNGDYVQTAGTTIANGEVQVDNGSLFLQGGVLKGDGLVDANVANTGGAIQPGNSVGSLDVEGNFSQASIAASLVIEIGGTGAAGTDYDVLQVTGTANVGGILQLTAVNGYVPSIGDTFTVLTAASRTGRFEAVIPCGTYEVSYTPTSVIVEVVGGPPVFGDLSCDGDVDAQDAGFLCGQLGLSSGDIGFNPAADLNDDGVIDYNDRAVMAGLFVPCPGDVVSNVSFQPPADGVVDGADLAYLLGSWGAGLSCADTVSNVTFAPPPDGVVDAADLAFLLGNWGPCD